MPTWSIEMLPRIVHRLAHGWPKVVAEVWMFLRWHIKRFLSGSGLRVEDFPVIPTALSNSCVRYPVTLWKPGAGACQRRGPVDDGAQRTAYATNFLRSAFNLTPTQLLE